jgi:hypothetical protein
VDCQFGSRPKPFQNNNLQFDAGFFISTWLTWRTHTGEENCGKICELGSPKRYAVWQDGAGGKQGIDCLCPSLAAPFAVRGEMSGGWCLVFGHWVGE